MKINTVALIGLGAMGSFFAPRLHARLGNNFRVIAGGERKKRLETRGVTINGVNYRFKITAPDDETGWNVKMTGFWSNGETLASWLLERMARLLEEQGRYQESMELATADHGKVWARYAHDSLCRCLRANHMTGGELFGIADPRLVDHWPSGNLHWGASRIVLFRTNASREVMPQAMRASGAAWVTYHHSFLPQGEPWARA